MQIRRGDLVERTAKASSSGPSKGDRNSGDLLLGLALVSETYAEEGERFTTFVTNQILRRTGWDEPRTESGEPAWLSLIALQEDLENHAYAVAQRLSSPEWLFFLRKIPWFIAGLGVPMPTEGYATAIAESITALSAKRPRPSEAALPFVAYPIDKELLTSLVRLRAITLVMQNVHAALRCVGKGAVITSREGLTPTTVPNAHLDEMMALWDRRVQGPGYSFLAEAGLYTHRFRTVPARSEWPDLLACAQRSEGRFKLSPLFLGALPTLLDPNLPLGLRFPTPVCDLVLLLMSVSVSRILDLRRPKSAETREQTAQFEASGIYFKTHDHAVHDLELTLALMREGLVGKFIPAGVSFGTPHEVLARLASTEVSLWPPSLGPAIREAADRLVFVDVWAATQRLEKALARPSEVAASSPFAKLWSTHFEKVVQEAIDNSAWKPSKRIADIRGVQLSIDGNWVTDIDAIGEKDGRLLLVSCKCVPMSEAWGRGEYGAVLNVASAVDKAVTDWADRVGKLRKRPHGDNYDFSAFGEIIGVVTLPTVPWTAADASIAEVAPGLRAAVSASELDAWITGR